MNAAPPIPCHWDGESFTPASPHWARVADRHFVVGQTYPMEVREDRSIASHRHYFAAINSAWENLPEDLVERFPTADHLRKFALIRCGYADQRSIACASKAEARRLAAFIKPMDTFAVVTVTEATVTVWAAKSQSMRAMGKRDFVESKAKVLDYIAGLIGTSASALEKNASAAA